MKVRKQVYHLNLADLRTSPIWEFALDEEGEEGQDEATVRPLRTGGPLDPADGMFIVRARFRLADDTQLQGYLTPTVQGDSSLGTLQPVIVTDQGQVMFWYGAFAPGADVIQKAYATLGKEPSQVFPITFEADVELVSGPVRGVLPGFLHYRSLSDRTVIEKR